MEWESEFTTSQRGSWWAKARSSSKLWMALTAERSRERAVISGNGKPIQKEEVTPRTEKLLWMFPERLSLEPGMTKTYQQRRRHGFEKSVRFIMRWRGENEMGDVYLKIDLRECSTNFAALKANSFSFVAFRSYQALLKKWSRPSELLHDLWEV